MAGEYKKTPMTARNRLTAKRSLIHNFFRLNLLMDATKCAQHNYQRIFLKKPSKII